MKVIWSISSKCYLSKITQELVPHKGILSTQIDKYEIMLAPKVGVIAETAVQKISKTSFKSGSLNTLNIWRQFRTYLFG